MGLFSEKKPYTAISYDCEALLKAGPDNDPTKLLDLVELIHDSVPRGSGGQEAGRFLRKKLKYGTPSEQGRALLLIETLVDNGVNTTYFIVECNLADQLVQLASNHSSNLTANSNLEMSKQLKAARRCRCLLQEWSTRDDRNLNNLYKRAGLGGRSEQRRKRGSYHPDDDLDVAVFGSDPHRDDTTTHHQRARSHSMNDRLLDPSSISDSAFPHSTSHTRNLSRGRISSVNNRTRTEREESPDSRSPSPINLRGSSLATTVATAHNIATRLTNELIVSPHGSKDLSVYYRQARQLRHQVIKLIHNPSSDVQQYIGQLLNANEELVNSLQAHDAVVEKKKALAGNDSYESLDATILGDDSSKIKPVRAPPSPNLISVDSNNDAAGTHKASSDNTPNGDPFADDFEQQERPKHTPLW